MFAIKWRCPECNHSYTTGFKEKLKRDLIEELEDGILVQCLNSDCSSYEEDFEANGSNAEITKI